ncbi:tyrosine-type recombinase/integrase [Aliivibrio fischeri]|uniref:tyrosine-type recombinase/integrase n=1 Tax=Aliivibrio fischeri TaxID=668 RepID=UPI0012D9FC86|nr:site-specific integrase [Aliivibrio fischeri]MUJ20465.1 tyrosine-type recombinase/integrase [Aliivibrio fischeri]
MTNKPVVLQPEYDVVSSTYKANNATEIRPSHLEAIYSKVGAEITEEMAETAAEFLKEYASIKGGMRDSSWAALQYHWHMFASYCKERGYQPIPTQHSVLKGYIEYRATLVKWSSLRSDVWAINSINKASGFGSPGADPIILATVKRISEKQVAEGRSIKQATALTYHDLMIIIENLENTTSLKELRALTCIALSFNCMLRSSELLALKVSDIDFKDKMLTIRISKTNHSGKPEVLRLSQFVIDILHKYFKLIGWDYEDPKLQDKNLFQRISRYDRLIKNNAPITTDTLREQVYKFAFEMVKDNHINEPPFSTHSSRVGGCQMLWEKKATLEEIMKTGRWSSSEMAYRYGRGYELVESTMNDTFDKK